MAAQVGGPGAPDGEDVAVEVAQVVLGGPQDQGRADDLAPGAAVLVVVAAVEAADIRSSNSARVSRPAA